MAILFPSVSDCCDNFQHRIVRLASQSHAAAAYYDISLKDRKIMMNPSCLDILKGMFFPFFIIKKYIYIYFYFLFCFLIEFYLFFDGRAVYVTEAVCLKTPNKTRPGFYDLADYLYGCKMSDIYI